MGYHLVSQQSQGTLQQQQHQPELKHATEQLSNLSQIQQSQSVSFAQRKPRGKGGNSGKVSKESLDPPPRSKSQHRLHRRSQSGSNLPTVSIPKVDNRGHMTP